MKRKVLATLMAVFMVVGMTAGCGNDVTPQYSSEPSSVASEETAYDSEAAKSSLEEFLSGTTEESSEASSQPEEDSEAMMSSPAQSYGEMESSPAAESTEEDEVGSSFIDTTPEPVTSNSSGIVVYMMWRDGNRDDCILLLINPETGGYQELNRFPIYTTSEGYFEYPYRIYYQNNKATFSQDATKLAVTYYDNSTKLRHAGWVDKNGTFFDVPKSLGMRAENEFVAQPNYYALGFTKDGEYFVFAEITGAQTSMIQYESNFDKFYYVSLNDLTTVYEGNPLSEEAYKGYYMYPITDWLNDSEYLVDLDTCTIRNANDAEIVTELVPGDARRNYNAVVGPSGKVAFASSIKNTGEDLAIYTIDCDGSNPQRVFDCSTIITPGGKFSGHFLILFVTQWR